MFEEDDEFYTSKVKAVVFIEKDNTVTIKFSGFEDQEHSAMFSSYLMMLLNIENAIINNIQSKAIH